MIEILTPVLVLEHCGGLVACGYFWAYIQVTSRTQSTYARDICNKTSQLLEPKSFIPTVLLSTEQIAQILFLYLYL